MPAYRLDTGKKQPVAMQSAERHSKHLSPLIATNSLADNERRSVFPTPI
nr:hypothetical protein [uncultured bacterium]